MNYDGILFDLDGTLWDSTKGIYKSWVKVLKTLPDIDHIPTMEEQESVMGLSDDVLMKKLFPELSPERGKEVFDLCCQVENVYLREKGGIAYDGIVETLEKLSKSHSLAIVSNCNDGYIEAYFASMGTEQYFADYESFGRTGKPKWENIKSDVERNGYKNPVYVVNFDKGEVLFTRVVENVTVTPEEYTYRIYPEQDSKDKYFDIVHKVKK